MADVNDVDEDNDSKIMPPSSLMPIGKRTLAQDLIIQELPGSMDIPKQVVVVMDGLKQFSMEPLEWVLKNVANGTSSCTVTLLGVMPWLNIPLSSKTRSDIWSMDLDDLSMIKEYWKNDAKYQKIRVLLDICEHYGVVLEIRTEMGHPLHLLVIEQIGSRRATLVVFDRHHDRKNIEYYAEKLPCNMVKMKEDGEFDMIRGRSRIDSVESTPGDDSSFVAPSPKVIFSEQIKKLLKQRPQSKHESMYKKWRIKKLQIFHLVARTASGKSKNV